MKVKKNMYNYMSYNFKANRNYKINASGLKIKTDDKNNALNIQNTVQINLPKGVSNAAELVSYLNSKKEDEKIAKL